MPMTGQQTLECINDDRVSTVPNHVLMATEGSSSAGYTAVAEAVHRHGATIFARLFHPEVMDGQRGPARRGPQRRAAGAVQGRARGPEHGRDKCSVAFVSEILLQVAPCRLSRRKEQPSRSSEIFIRERI